MAIEIGDLPIDSMVMFHSFLLTFTRGYLQPVMFHQFPSKVTMSKSETTNHVRFLISIYIYSNINNTSQILRLDQEILRRLGIYPLIPQCTYIYIYTLYNSVYIYICSTDHIPYIPTFPNHLVAGGELLGLLQGCSGSNDWMLIFQIFFSIPMCVHYTRWGGFNP